MRYLLLLALCSTLYVSLRAQGSPPPCNATKPSKAAVQKSKSPKSKPLALGVLNGRATRLVKPEYPRSATQLNVRGTVITQVIINENGCVVDARVVSGHPFLRAASIKAAFASTFQPVLVNGEPRQVTGFIDYIFLPNSMNWLELGFHSNSLSDLDQFLPSDRSNIRAAIQMIPRQSYFDQVQIEKIGTFVETDLAGDPKNQWLFRAGKQLKIIDTSCWIKCEENSSSISQLLDQAPTDVSPNLITKLGELILEKDPKNIRPCIQFLKDRLFDLGN